ARVGRAVGSARGWPQSTTKALLPRFDPLEDEQELVVVEDRLKHARPYGKLLGGPTLEQLLRFRGSPTHLQRIAFNFVDTLSLVLGPNRPFVALFPTGKQLPPEQPSIPLTVAGLFGEVDVFRVFLGIDGELGRLLRPRACDINANLVVRDDDKHLCD